MPLHRTLDLLAASRYRYPVAQLPRFALSPVPKLPLRPPITVVVSLEGLATSPLGCYGCSWNQTPAIDALAADGLVWDRWTSPIDRPRGLITSWLCQSAAVIDQANRRGRSYFLTDDQTLTVPEQSQNFQSVIHLRPNRLETPAESIEQTTLAQSFTAAINEIDSQTSLLWLHSAALRDIWDAPLEEIDDEGPLEPIEHASDQDDGSESQTEPVEPFRLPSRTDVPSLRLHPDQDDPDMPFAWTERYAAQVRVLDTMLDSLCQALEKRKATIVVAGSSGFSLGQNGWIGHRQGPLRSQDIRLPLIVSSGGPLRIPTLQTADELPELLARIADRRPLVTPEQWCHNDEPFAPMIQTESDRARAAVTTATWFYVDDAPEQSLGDEKLYLKPDDVDDCNDISRLRREVLDELAAVAGQH
ncbi:hypothetical protein NHH03_06705 [Stieleria sp. TO1_6]|uniref:hypothetical protein n=1 Tax=Stieleria tagensis TaxID=2956795 RepID=UPI00209B2599|nr:hypothetical protein [Stieleria tagensis]MCO8121421.1 hypothetical protein [Stieleria tagensis]